MSIASSVGGPVVEWVGGISFDLFVCFNNSIYIAQMESFFQNEFFGGNDKAAEWITTSGSHRSKRSSNGNEGDAFLVRDDRNETSGSPSKHSHDSSSNKNSGSFEHKHRNDENIHTAEIPIPSPSTFEIGEMAKNNNHSLNNGNAPLDKQEHEEKQSHGACAA